jgi:hypothetical protein
MISKKVNIAFSSLTADGNITTDCNTIQIKNRGTATATLTLATKTITILPDEFQIFGGYEWAKLTDTFAATFGTGTKSLEIVKQTFADLS